MSANFYELLRYAKTGIASPGMTGYDKTRALFLFGGAAYPETTITGIPPISFKSDGTPLTAWSISGDMAQTGMPTPDAPIMPEFVGERTGNLFDFNATDTTNGYVNGAYLLSDGSENVNTPYRISEYVEIQGSTVYTLVYGNSLNNQSLCFYDSSKQYISGQKYGNNRTVTVTSPSNAKYVRISYTYTVRDSVMLNTGSTALDYEPYGFKIPITCAGQTTPIYLGQTQTVRRIKKLVFDGVLGWSKSSSATNTYMISYSAIGIDAPSNRSQGYCSHAAITSFLSNIIDGQFIFGTERIYFRNDNTSTKDSFNAWLASQYAAGTPVTVWYVLATPETGIVNEPLAKIGDYADELSSTDAGVTIPTAKGQNTLSIGTTLQPSEVSITGHIKQA